MTTLFFCPSAASVKPFSPSDLDWGQKFAFSIEARETSLDSDELTLIGALSNLDLGLGLDLKKNKAHLNTLKTEPLAD
jgi:hypothetical protein